MSEKETYELKELDAWIHVNLFEGKKFVGLKKRGLWYRPKGCGYTDLQDEAGRYTLEEAKKHEYPPKPSKFVVSDPVTISEFSPRNYTTDPASAMEVLKKCIENGYSPAISRPFFSDEHAELYFLKDESSEIYAKSETLELAICLFSRKLFEK